MKKILQFKLKILAKMILWRYQPRIVGITGSVGKTSAKEACFAVLSAGFRVRQNIKNYNNEIGLPLTIIGAETAGRSILGWIKVFWKAVWIFIVKDKNYPEVLVLEMGIDRPGDMDYLLSIVHPTVGVITAIGQSHLEYFGTIDRVKEEKGKLVKNLPSSCWAVLNYDDEKVRSLASKASAQVVSFGFEEGATIRAEYLGIGNRNGLLGVEFGMNYKGPYIVIFLPGAISKTAVYSVLAAYASALAMGMDFDKVKDSINNFKLPKGRMNIVAGIKESIIIDDTYNASPQSTMAALDALKEAKLGGRRLAVLGDMLELGSYEEEGHKAVGKKVFDNKINILISVGDRARFINSGAKEAGMADAGNMYFDNQEGALKYLKDNIKPGDIILVKGSQGARMEKMVKEIMAEQSRSAELLVRQDREWQDR